MSIVKVRQYRSEPGDVGIPDIFTPTVPLEDAVKLAMERLRVAAEDRRVEAHKRPIWTDLVASDGTVLIEITMTSLGPCQAVRGGS
jgi:hypothetical protein